MSSEQFELIEAPENPRPEQEEALLRDAEKIVGSAVPYFVNIFEDPSIRRRLEKLTGDELGWQEMKDATVTIALLQVAAQSAYVTAEHKRALKQDGEEIPEGEIGALKNDYGRFSALREVLVREHSILSRYARPFSAKISEDKKVSVSENKEFLREDHLRQWAEEYAKKIKERHEEAQKTGEEKGKKFWESRYRTNLPLVELYLEKMERLQSIRYDDMIGILEEEITEATSRLGLALYQHCSEGNVESVKSIFDLEDSIERYKAFMAMLEGEKAEKIALEK